MGLGGDQVGKDMENDLGMSWSVISDLVAIWFMPYLAKGLCLIGDYGGDLWSVIPLGG